MNNTTTSCHAIRPEPWTVCNTSRAGSIREGPRARNEATSPAVNEMRRQAFRVAEPSAVAWCPGPCGASPRLGRLPTCVVAKGAARELSCAHDGHVSIILKSMLPAQREPRRGEVARPVPWRMPSIEGRRPGGWMDAGAEKGKLFERLRRLLLVSRVVERGEDGKPSGLAVVPSEQLSLIHISEPTRPEPI
eukprot:2420722-Pyramimonas_sp.AAC.1